MDTQSLRVADRATAGQHGQDTPTPDRAPDAATPQKPFTWDRRDTDAAFAVLLALDVTRDHALADELRSTVLALQDGATPTVEAAWTLFEAVRRSSTTLLSEGYSYVVARARALGARVGLAVCGFPVRDVSRVRFGASQGFIIRTADSVLLYEHGVFKTFATMRAFPDATGTP